MRYHFLLSLKNKWKGMIIPCWCGCGQIRTVIYLLGTILVSCCHCDNLPHNSWLKETQIYSLIALELRSLKWIVRAAFLLEAVGENRFPCLCQDIEPTLILGLCLPHHSNLFSWSLVLWLWPFSLPLVRNPVITLGPPR